MSRIIFCNTEDKTGILKTLLAFNEDKTKTFKKKKYQYADKLIAYRKSDLETARADLEDYIDNSRTFAALVAAVGVVLPTWLSLGIPENLKLLNIEVVLTLLLFALGAVLFLRVARAVAWLHVMKIAISRKSELDFTNSPPPITTAKKRQSGSAKGLLWISPDFDEPLADFNEYVE